MNEIEKTDFLPLLIYIYIYNNKMVATCAKIINPLSCDATKESGGRKMNIVRRTGVKVVDAK